jgi:branched-chain amino acid transport system ATP-binding protein
VNDASTQNITQIFGGLNALEDVSFSVRKDPFPALSVPTGRENHAFNIVTVLYTQTGGDVFLGRRKYFFSGNRRTCRPGLVRTFQNV